MRGNSSEPRENRRMRKFRRSVQEPPYTISFNPPAKAPQNSEIQPSPGSITARQSFNLPPEAPQNPENQPACGSTAVSDGSTVPRKHRRTRKRTLHPGNPRTRKSADSRKRDLAYTFIRHAGVLPHEEVKPRDRNKVAHGASSRRGRPARTPEFRRPTGASSSGATTPRSGVPPAVRRFITRRNRPARFRIGCRLLMCMRGSGQA
jgi:hypothetical protein